MGARTWAAALLATTPLCAQGPASVLVVINENSALSRAIGEYYARARGIPVKNICRLHAPVGEDIDRVEYDAKIAGTIAKCLRSRGLVESVLYIVTTAGVPLRIRGSEGMSGDIAAVDSELAPLYDDLHGQPHPIRGPLRNPFFGQREKSFTHPEFPIYLVTRLAAYDFAGVKAMIDRALAAANRGRFVIDLRGSDDTGGNRWLRDAAILLPKERVVLDETDAVLYDQRDVIGYASWGSNDRARKRRFPGFRWLPGAIMTEFVSSDARTFEPPPDTWTIGTWKDKKSWFAGSPQTLTADYIEEGVTGASGHVAEPYLGLTPRPDFLLPAYYGGRNLAESYYQAIPSVSWQNVVIGDPLCAIGKPAANGRK